MSEKKNTIPIELLQMMMRDERDNFSLSSSLYSTQKKINEELEKSVVMNHKFKDSYGNATTSVGDDDIIKKFTSYGMNNDTLNFPLWTALYNDSWVFKRAIDKPAQDMVRAGVTLGNLDNEKSSFIYKKLLSFRPQLIELVQWGRLFGGAVAVMMFDNVKDVDYARALTKDTLAKSKILKLYVTDRWYGCSVSSKTVGDMNDDDFGKPEFYSIVFADGREVKVHHSYVLRYEGRNAPRLIKNGYLQGWGYAEGAHILNELARDDQLKSSITSLVNKSLIEVIKMSGMRGVFMGSVDEEGEAQLRKRLEMVNWARNYNSLTLLDKDDEYSQFVFGGLSGLSDLMTNNMQLIASALEMQGVLFGDLKGGLGDDTKALERYDETINNLCENYYRAPLTKLIKVLYMMNGVEEKVEFSFNSLLVDRKDEKRMQGIKDFQAALSGMLSDGVISPRKYAEVLMNYCSKGIINISFTDEELDEIDERVKDEMEDIDLNENNDTSPLIDLNSKK